MEFDRFDVINEVPQDHYYLQLPKDMNLLNYRKVMREWITLERNLPESIHVQTYESRIDLLRAVIVGPPETPYHDALFFFDIALPWDYPNDPPKLHFHSHGYRVNPNLYENGEVCMSLINTTGTGGGGGRDEKWRKASTILEMLESIQGLVLNQTPYFNYTNYNAYRNDPSPRWVHASNAYNRKAFFLCWTTMLKIIRQPPQKFEGFVVQHFRGRALSILAAIEHYYEGRAMVGFWNASSSSSQFQFCSVQVPETFRAFLIMIQQQLKDVFAALGISDLPNTNMIDMIEKPRISDLPNTNEPRISDLPNTNMVEKSRISDLPNTNIISDLRNKNMAVEDSLLPNKNMAANKNMTASVLPNKNIAAKKLIISDLPNTNMAANKNMTASVLPNKNIVAKKLIISDLPNTNMAGKKPRITHLPNMKTKMAGEKPRVMAGEKPRAVTVIKEGEKSEEGEKSRAVIKEGEKPRAVMKADVGEAVIKEWGWADSIINFPTRQMKKLTWVKKIAFLVIMVTFAVQD